jgi:O-glycosyl hydrolase
LAAAGLGPIAHDDFYGPEEKPPRAAVHSLNPIRPGLVTLKHDGSVLKSGQYHALRHFSQHLQKEGRRIASGSDAPGLRHLAVRNPDGGFALVMMNPGAGKDLRIVSAGQQLSFSLPGNAVATLAW